MKLKITLLLWKLLSVVKFINADIEGKIVGGEFSRIKDFPHSVYVTIESVDKSSTCGASILNQAILLTAAHCLYSCKMKCIIKAYTGSERKGQGFISNVIRYKIHEKYNKVSKAKDIALMRLGKELKLGKKVKRVAIMRKPPNHESGVIAGWGWINSIGGKTNFLKHARQLVFSRKTCISKLRAIIPFGSFCGRDFKGTSYPERGDSGSALVVFGSIQIGIVSFKNRRRANDIIVYTDVSYYYDWIVKNAKDLYCKDYRKKTFKWVKKVERKKRFFNGKVKGRMGEEDLNFDCS